MRAVHYEWLRFSSVRSSWLALAACVLGGTVLGAFYRFASVRSIEGALSVTEAPILLLTFVASVPVARAVGDDYRYGLARTTLTLFPGRTGIFAAKCAVSVLPATIAVGLGVAGALAASSVTSGSGISPGVLATVVSRQVLYAAVYLVLVYAVAALTRSTAIGVVAVFLLSLFLEQTVARQILDLPASLLPFASATSFRQAGAGGYADLAVFGAYAVVTLGAAWATYRWRDA